MKEEIKTIEELENNYWTETDFSSSLVRLCHEYRKIPVDKLSTEQLRFLIRQDVGVHHIMPFALQQLKENIFAEGDFYEGDLLVAVLTVHEAYWNTHPDEKVQLTALLVADFPAKDRNGSESRSIRKAIQLFLEQYPC